MPLPISADDNAQATLAATEIGQIMAGGATVGPTTVIPATPNFASNADVVNAFKAMAAGVLRRTGATGSLAVVEILRGTQQLIPLSTLSALPLLVVVRDSANQPVQGVVVSFTFPAGTGGVPAATLTSPAPTDASGQAQVFATANGIAGSYIVRATVSGIPSVDFTLTNIDQFVGKYYTNAYVSGAQAIPGQGAGPQVYTVINYGVVPKNIGGGLVTGSNWRFHTAPGQDGIYHIETLVAVTSPNSGDVAELSLWRWNDNPSNPPQDTLEQVLAHVRTTPVSGATGSYLHGSTYIELDSQPDTFFQIRLRITNSSAQTLVAATATQGGYTSNVNWIRILKVA